ncbi:hypothetical protein C943_02337 [Mariniradius saccharolyticus AK6]|uniref:Uncharacterized protein n=1 Tax=Mariniradius saccharolyticus AK6 TaxID=1239962 RepID=M7X0Y2_9BACT|nr:hypothetical protein C943_02337 [Mariniradius saccharolyticus AK6]
MSMENQRRRSGPKYLKNAAQANVYMPINNNMPRIGMG